MTRLTSRQLRINRLEANAAWLREQDRTAEVRRAHYEQQAQAIVDRDHVPDRHAVPDKPKREEK